MTNFISMTFMYRIWVYMFFFFGFGISCLVFGSGSRMRIGAQVGMIYGTADFSFSLIVNSSGHSFSCAGFWR